MGPHVTATTVSLIICMCKLKRVCGAWSLGHSVLCLVLGNKTDDEKLTSCCPQPHCNFKSHQGAYTVFRLLLLMFVLDRFKYSYSSSSSSSSTLVHLHTQVFTWKRKLRCIVSSEGPHFSPPLFCISLVSTFTPLLPHQNSNYIRDPYLHMLLSRLIPTPTTHVCVWAVLKDFLNAVCVSPPLP